MSSRHFQFWPKSLPKSVTLPETDIFTNLSISALRFPDKAALIFYDTKVTYRRLKQEAEQISGWLQSKGVIKGDRVLLDMQNSPQFVVAYYAILAAGAVVVPINPMNRTAELHHYVEDAGARIAIVSDEVAAQMIPLLTEGLSEVLVATYSDYIEVETDLDIPDFIKAPSRTEAARGVSLWRDVFSQAHAFKPVTVGPDDLCVFPYTSGTTGKPKGCVHTHRTVMATIMSSVQWFMVQQDAVYLSVAPYFHVTGMQGTMNGPIFAGATVALLPRWDRVAAAKLITRYGVSKWSAVPAMLIDFLGQPGIETYDLSSLHAISGGGATMPEAIAQKLLDMGIVYFEGYGLSETMAQTHLNPLDNPKKQCLGIPCFDTFARVIDPETFEEKAIGEVGEIITRGPGIFKGYWNAPEATKESFVEIDGHSWFRTGDLGIVDEDGYFFMIDRLKRMINAAGFKVWPAEVEAMLYAHPAIHEACIIASRDAARGETVKAVVVLKPAHAGQVSEADIVEWARTQMAAYKVPRLVQFVETLPKSGTGKIMWRALQDAELKG